MKSKISSITRLKVHVPICTLKISNDWIVVNIVGMDRRQSLFACKVNYKHYQGNSQNLNLVRKTELLLVCRKN